MILYSPLFSFFFFFFQKVKNFCGQKKLYFVFVKKFRQRRNYHEKLKISFPWKKKQEKKRKEGKQF